MKTAQKIAEYELRNRVIDMTNTDTTILHTALTYAGAIPFIACAAFLSLDFHPTFINVSIAEILTTYTLLIATFMAGAYWGLYIRDEERSLAHLTILSNAFAIGLWCSFLVLDTLSFLLFCAAYFCILLIVEYSLFKKYIVSRSYFSLRLMITVIVVTCLITSIMNLEA